MHYLLKWPYISMHQVRDHLKDYLDRSYRLLEENEVEVADQNLYLLIIQCFEVCVCVCARVRVFVYEHHIFIFINRMHCVRCCPPTT
jgi:hypothetical protein